MFRYGERLRFSLHTCAPDESIYAYICAALDTLAGHIFIQLKIYMEITTLICFRNISQRQTGRHLTTRIELALQCAARKTIYGLAANVV